jgi:hypothetical protein
LGALVLAGCSVTETGNPPLDATMTVTGRSTEPLIASIRSDGGRVRVDAAWVVLGDVRFVMADVCDAPEAGHVDVPGPTFADVTAPAPFVVRFELAPDAYCRVRVPLARALDPLPSGPPAAILDRAILVEGRRDDGVPFSVASRVTPEIDVRSRTAPFRLDDGGRSLHLAFDVARWFDGVDLDAAVIGGDGRIRVEDGTNDEILDAIESNAEESIELFRDDDADGTLDDDEDVEPLADAEDTGGGT